MEFKGTSQLALMADDLPIRARACLGLLAADIGLQHLQKSPELGLARDTMKLVLNWHDGKPVDLAALEDMLEDEETSLSFAALRAGKRSKAELPAWCLFGGAVHYAAFLAFREVNRYPTTSLSNQDETVLDDLDRDLRALAPSLMAVMTRAAAYLKQHPDASLAQLKAHVSER
jgi:hypothetical protein